MSVQEIAAAGPAPAQLAWQRYADLRTWSQWAPQIARVDASADTLALGVHGTVCAAHLVNVPFVVTAVDAAAMTWSWIARLGPVALTLHHAVCGTAAGSRTTLVLEGPAVVVAAYAPLARVALGRLVAAPDEGVPD